MNVKVISRAAARSAGLTHYFTGVACKNGHIAKRYVRDTKCLECHRAKHAKLREKNWKHPSTREQLAAERLLREQALEKGDVHYQSVIPCVRGHIGARYTRQQSCVECARQNSRKAYWKDPKTAALARRQRRLANLQNERARDRAYHLRNRAERSRKHVALRRRKRQTDPVYMMKCRVRSLLKNALTSRSFSQNLRTSQVLGCTWQELRLHIERQFLAGMSWENRHLWEIDHIVPLATAKTEHEVISLSHVSNLRPLWAKDNRQKSDNVLFLI